MHWTPDSCGCIERHAVYEAGLGGALGGVSQIHIETSNGQYRVSCFGIPIQ